MNTSKAAVVVSAIFGKILSIAGYSSAILGIVGFIVELSGGLVSGDVVFAFFFLALGIFLIFRGSQIKRRIKRFRRYVSLISIQQMRSLENLAVNTSQSVDFVRKDLQKMIDKKFFANASINLATSEIVICGTTSQVASQAHAQHSPTTMHSELERFTCPSCGATGTKTKGVVGNCDYCGSFVN